MQCDQMFECNIKWVNSISFRHAPQTYFGFQYQSPFEVQLARNAYRRMTAH